MKTNVLYYGDNLEILRKYIPADSVDLIYLDPPFNSQKDYNVLFKENGGVESEAQIQAFTDTWRWTQSAQDADHDIVTNGPLKVGQLIGALHEAIGNNDVMAYLEARRDARLASSSLFAAAIASALVLLAAAFALVVRRGRRRSAV